MGEIRILEATVADRIAAGEVVERPASVLRELIDNALDAGARRLEIELEGGGIDEVSVADDGKGMHAEDAPLAFARHATSKISTGDDLAAIRTLGFRGEALAAIAAVSRVELLSRRAEDEAGTRLIVERGVPREPTPAARAPGTTLSVRALFEGIPARRKFLKTQGTELDHAMRVARRAALARPEIAFRVRHGGRVLLDLPPAEGTAARARAVLGERYGRALVPVDEVAGPMRLGGFIARADVHRNTREGIHVHVNRRPVRDPLLLRAVVDAFRNTLPPGRFPVGVLELELPAGDVDVNVHPAKAEVRFHRPREVRALVVGGLARALGGEGARPHLAPGSGSGARPFGERPAGRGDAEAGFFGPPGAGAGAGGARFGTPPGVENARERLFGELGASLEGARKEAGGAGPAWPAHAGRSDGRPADPALFERARVRPLAQYRNCYIVAEDDAGLLIVDQHVAHERLLFERLVKQADAGPLPRQGALFPIVLEVGAERAEVASEREELLLRCGFRVESFGPESVRVSEVPAVMGREAGPGALEILLTRLARGDKLSAEAIYDELLATVACHSAVRKGMALSLEKMAYILGGLEACEAPHHCPHGRAVSMRIDLSALDRAFGRS